MPVEMIEDITEDRRRLFKQAEAEVADMRIADEHKFGAVNALYIHKLNKQAGLDDVAALAAVYVSGVQHGMAVSRVPNWFGLGAALPEPLQDVFVVYMFDDEPSTDLAFLRKDGKWFLTGSDLEIKPLMWQPTPPLPAHLQPTAH